MRRIRKRPLTTMEGSVQYLLHQGDWNVHTCRFSPDGHSIAFKVIRGLKILDLATKDPVHILEHQALSDCAFSPDGDLIVTTSYRSSAVVWSVTTGERLATKTNYASFSACAYFPDGNGFMTIDGDNIMHTWNIVADQGFWGGIGLDENRNGYMSFCTISPDALRTVYNSWYQGLQVWDLHTRQPVLTLAGRPGEIASCSFSPDGRLIIASGSDDQVWVWDSITGELLMKLTGHTGFVRASTFTPDARCVVTAGEDKTVRIWDVESGRMVRELPHSFPLSSVAVHPNTPKLACGDTKHYLYLWELLDHCYGPLVVTALRFESGLRVRCPSCWQTFEIDEETLGHEKVCPTPGCQTGLKLNDFVL